MPPIFFLIRLMITGEPNPHGIIVKMKPVMPVKIIRPEHEAIAKHSVNASSFKLVYDKIEGAVRPDLIKDVCYLKPQRLVLIEAECYLGHFLCHGWSPVGTIRAIRGFNYCPLNFQAFLTHKHRLCDTNLLNANFLPCWG